MLPHWDISLLHLLWSTNQWRTATKTSNNMHVRRVEKTKIWVVFVSNRNRQLSLQTPEQALTQQQSHFLSVVAVWSENNRWITRTPAAIDAMVFLLSPQSTLHSQSPHRIPSRKPDMTLGAGRQVTASRGNGDKIPNTGDAVNYLNRKAHHFLF